MPIGEPQAMTTITPTGSSRSWRIAYLVSILLILAAGWPTLFFPFGRDQGIHASIAYALSEGIVTYRDVFNLKPPLTTAVHLLSQWIFGHSMMAIRALDLVFASLAAMGLVSIVRRCGLPPVAGAFAAFGLAIIYCSQIYWNNSQTDAWAGFLVIGAAVAMLSGWARPEGHARRARMGLAGALLGLAFLLKYTVGAAGILVFTPLLAGREARFFISDFIFVTLGGIAVLALVLLTMAAAGALGPFFEIQRYILGYIAHDPLDIPFGVQMMIIAQHPITISVVIIGACVWLLGLYTREAKLLHALIALWTVAGAASGFIQGRSFLYHFLPLVGPYSLLIGLAGWRGMQLARRLGMRFPAIPVALIAVAIYPQTGAGERIPRSIAALASDAPVDTMRSYVQPMVDFDVNATLAFNDRLSELREPGDSLFVWGYGTMLYFLQKEPPRYRYPYSWPFVVTFYDGRYTADLMDRLETVPPKHIVVQTGDATPWVTGRAESSKEFLESFDPLSEFIDTRYELIEEMPRFELWELRQ